ncbi:MAG: LamG domain-containing protein, partial [Bacteroidota bacterium]
MRKLYAAIGAAAILLCALTAAVSAAEAPKEPWQQLYTGQEATGPNVIGLWQFLPGQETSDNSGHKHDLALQGQSRFVKEGPFGAALESFVANAENDKPQGVITKDTPDLSPAGAFTLEAWFTAKPEMEQSPNVFLLDKKVYNYAKDLPQANWDYCLYMPRSGVNKRRLTVSLGFGKDSAFVTGPEIDTTPGQWRHVAFTYDGAGLCRFFIDGKLMAKVPLEGRGPITPGNNALTIGDRLGSTHTGFPGYLAQV